MQIFSIYRLVNHLQIFVKIMRTKDKWRYRYEKFLFGEAGRLKRTMTFRRRLCDAARWSTWSLFALFAFKRLTALDKWDWYYREQSIPKSSSSRGIALQAPTDLADESFNYTRLVLEVRKRRRKKGEEQSAPLWYVYKRSILFLASLNPPWLLSSFFCRRVIHLLADPNLWEKGASVEFGSRCLRMQTCFEL